MGGKWVEILKELAPAVARVGFLFNPPTSPGGGSYFFRPVEVASPSFNLQSTTIPVEDAAEIGRAVASLAAEPNGGLIVNSDSFTTSNRMAIIAAAARHRVPAIYPCRPFATSGGLVSYGVDFVDQWRQAAAYVDRILKGGKPADLPVQQPTRFEMVINLKTANALGLAVPPLLLTRADDVIE